MMSKWHIEQRADGPYREWLIMENENVVATTPWMEEAEGIVHLRAMADAGTELVKALRKHYILGYVTEIEGAIEAYEKASK